MKHLKCSFFILLLLCFEQACSTTTSLLQLYPVNWSGTDALRKGAYETALQQALADSSVLDTVCHYFKLACIHQKLKNHGKSIFLFKFVAQKCSTLAPMAYEHIAELELEAGQKQNVIPAYGAVLKYGISQKYRHKIFAKIKSMAEIDSSELKKVSWYSEYKEWLSFNSKTNQKLTENRVHSLIKKCEWKAIDSLLDSVPLEPEISCEEALSITSSEGIDSLSTGSIFYLSRILYSCKKTDLAASLLDKSKRRHDFHKSVPHNKALYLEAQILYAQENYSKAIPLFKKYELKFGTSLELILYIARGYRKLGKVKECNTWYTKLIRLYPSHKKAKEAIWLRAWQKEELKNFKGAAQEYANIYKSKGDNDYKDEAFLRHALVYYRLEKYDSALVVLDNFKKVLPNSPLYLAADFWKAKCFFALEKDSAAVKLFHQISNAEPYDYYAHRSRQILFVLGDSSKPSIDSVFDIERTVKWLDSIPTVYPKKQLSTSDSSDYRMGVFLASVGKLDAAEYFLEPLENSFPGNLNLQFNVAMLYTIVDASTQAFRVARKLTWRIPQQERGFLPLPVYSLLYPSFYEDLIKNNGSQYSVDPYLVSSVIRQESIFNPGILSPVGAVGLMQIMPYTGKYIADQLKESFLVDSLTRPHFNIRYGVYYLRELLDQFNDNLVLVLASYNGGPHNVKKWYDRNKDEEYDLFIEDLFFSETRNYVKRVLGNYWTYQLLARYPGLKHIYPVGQNVANISAKDTILVKNR